ncbi:T9SS type A sorting domain-containing protein [Rubrivirga sp.]|uniref:T9SS type A sorting domain-containing protein n=1 Tax=Rubrivirga sp. TaxID=1885344 RepID=UPI003B516BC3
MSLSTLHRVPLARVLGALALLMPAVASAATFPSSTPVADSDGDLKAGSVGAVEVATTVDTVGEAVAVFDFTLTDGGASDNAAMDVSQIVVHSAGSISDADRGKLVVRLSGPDATDVVGVYDGGAHTYTFSGLTISVADGTSETYTVDAYWSSSVGLADNVTVSFSVDGDTDLVVDGAGTQMGPTDPVTNTATVAVEASVLVVTHQPGGSVSGVALVGQPAVEAQDAFGNVDDDFAETLTLTEASAGAISGATAVAAVHGRAAFAGLIYTATADQESFTLTVDDQAGVGSDLAAADMNAVTSDVVATALAFSTEPAPTTVASGALTNFSTVPVVQAVDDDGTVDTGYSTDITLAEVNGAGSATMAATGDTDGNAATVTLTPSAGVATFTTFQATYTASGGSDETFNLQASSGALTAATSAQLTATVNPAPVFAEGPTGSFTALEDVSAFGLDDILAAADDTGETLTWTVKTAPSSGTLNGFPVSLAAGGSTAVTPTGLAYSAAADVNGSDVDSFVIEVGDGTSTAEMTVTVHLTAVNDAPTFAKGANQTVQENAGAQVVMDWATAISAGPANEAWQDVAFHVTVDNPALFALDPWVYPNGALEFEPAPDASGTATLTVVAYDDGGTANGGVHESAPQTFTISIAAVNGAPTISELPALSILEDESSQPVPFSVDDTETAAADLAVRAVSSDSTLIGASGLVLGGTGGARTLAVTPVADAHGSAQVTVTVSDGDHETATTFTVVVQPVADAPRYASDAPAPTVGTKGNWVDLSSDSTQTFRVEWPAATDVDGDGAAFEYAWELSADSTFGTLLVTIDASASDATGGMEATADVVATEMLGLDVPVTVFASAYDALGLPAGTSATMHHRVRATAGDRTATTAAATLTVTPAQATASEETAVPDALTLAGNYPNPAGVSTRIRYAVPTAAPVRLEVFDALGRRVQVLVDGPQTAGWHEAVLDARALQSGTYLYRVVSNGVAATRSLVVLK